MESKSQLLAKLKKQYEPPREFETLRKFNTIEISKLLGISQGYLFNILGGSKTPSNGLRKRIEELIEEIKQEQQKAGEFNYGI
ncbi:MAG: hypothetical protein HQK63_14565 [Desulfamplus sp.]|nr:hypothetical protein [Desulfamplus sp.]